MVPWRIGDRLDATGRFSSTPTDTSPSCRVGTMPSQNAACWKRCSLWHKHAQRVVACSSFHNRHSRTGAAPVIPSSLLRDSFANLTDAEFARRPRQAETSGVGHFPTTWLGVPRPRRRYSRGPGVARSCGYVCHRARTSRRGRRRSKRGLAPLPSIASMQAGAVRPPLYLPSPSLGFSSSFLSGLAGSELSTDWMRGSDGSTPGSEPSTD